MVGRTVASCGATYTPQTFEGAPNRLVRPAPVLLVKVVLALGVVGRATGDGCSKDQRLAALGVSVAPMSRLKHGGWVGGGCGDSGHR